MVDEKQLLQRNEKVWAGFCKLLTWSLIGVIVTLVLMAIFLI
jgi:tetrahydromethanopterin S-methyltransferase subunit F